MKNRKVYTMLAIVITAGMVATSTGVAYAAPVTKDETVYVKMDRDGNQTEITVSDQISNVKHMADIKDLSTLLDIENVKGDEIFSQEGDTLTWKNDGSDKICYQGTTKEELPIGMTIRYELDGNEVTSKEVEGQSGHLKISVNYENHTSKTDYVPFMVVSGMVLDPDVFSNVTVNHGKLVSDGEKELVVGYGLPGMTDYLGISDTPSLEEVEIPEGFIVEADVTDFEKIVCISYATDEIFAELSEQKINSLDDLKDSMGELSDAANQLVNGSGELRDGIETLLEGTSALDSGTTKLLDGGAALKQGTSSLSAGAIQLQTGVSALAEGTSSLSQGSKDLVNGTAQLAQGSASAKEGANQLSEGIYTAGIGIQNLSTGLSQVKSGTEGIRQLTEAVAASLPTTASDTVNTTVFVDNSDLRGSVDSVLRSAGVDEDIIAATLAQISDKNENVSLPVTLSVDVSTASAYVQQLQQTAETVDSGIAGLQSGAGQLETATTQLQGGISSLGDGLQFLEAGAEKVSAGSIALDAGINEVDGGAKQLLTGTGTMNVGASTLDNGMEDLYKGLLTLSQGTSELTDGVKKLDDGAIKLNEGMIQFDEDGIQKLLSFFDDNLSDLLDRVNGLGDRAKAYNNYSGMTDEMDGSVKFIFMTE